MIITFIIVGGLVAVAFGIINCVHSLVRANSTDKTEREAARNK